MFYSGHAKAALKHSVSLTSVDVPEVIPFLSSSHRGSPLATCEITNEDRFVRRPGQKHRTIHFHNTHPSVVLTQYWNAHAATSFTASHDKTLPFCAQDTTSRPSREERTWDMVTVPMQRCSLIQVRVNGSHSNRFGVALWWPYFVTRHRHLIHAICVPLNARHISLSSASMESLHHSSRHAQFLYQSLYKIISSWLPIATNRTQCSPLTRAEHRQHRWALTETRNMLCQYPNPTSSLSPDCKVT